MKDLSLEFYKCLAGILRNTFENKISTRAYYTQNNKAAIQISNWIDKNGNIISVEIQFDTGFIEWDGRTNTLKQNPIPQISIICGDGMGYFNSHVWSNGKVCRSGRPIENAGALLREFATFLLLNNISNDSISLGHPCPDNRLCSGNVVNNHLTEKMIYKNKIQQHFCFTKSTYNNIENLSSVIENRFSMLINNILRS